MQTKLSTKGQVVLPVTLRRRLNIQPGDPLNAEVENGRIILTPPKKRRLKVKIVTDPMTGLPALSGGPSAPTLTGKEVDELLAGFP